MQYDYVIESIWIEQNSFSIYEKSARKFPFVPSLRGEYDTCTPNFGILSGIFTHPKNIGKPQN